MKILLNLNHFGEIEIPEQTLFNIQWDPHVAEDYYSLLNSDEHAEVGSNKFYQELFKTWSTRMKVYYGFEVDQSLEDLFECITFISRDFGNQERALGWLHHYYERAQNVVIDASAGRSTDTYSDYAPDFVRGLIQASMQIDDGDLAITFLQWMEGEEKEFFEDNFFRDELNKLCPVDKGSFIKDIEAFIMEHPYMKGRNHENWEPGEVIGDGKEITEVNIVVMNDDGTATGILITNTKPE